VNNIIPFVAKTLGYMLTWTTYGTWLQGDDRRYVSNGQVLNGDKELFQLCEFLQKGLTVKLNYKEKQIVHNAIIKESKSIGQKVLALAVYSNHVHLVLEYIPKPISEIVAYYKKAGRLALKDAGITGRVWSKGYDKRYCFDEVTLNNRIKYVNKHK